MIKFRQHRGSLAESLKTEINIYTLGEIEYTLKGSFLGISPKELTCEFYSQDNRGIDYDDTYVITGMLGDVRAVLGFSNGMLCYQNKLKTLVFKDFQDYKDNSNDGANGVSQEFADANPNYEKDNETNVNCWNCKGCTNCAYCNGCNNCNQCYRCNTCCRCTDCGHCSASSLCNNGEYLSSFFNNKDSLSIHQRGYLINNN